MSQLIFLLSILIVFLNFILYNPLTNIDFLHVINELILSLKCSELSWKEKLNYVLGKHNYYY
jgi:hypothetical protein